MTGRLAPVLLGGALLVAAAACSSGASSGGSSSPSATGSSTTTAVAVPATVPPVAPGVRDCGTQDDLAGWPTTMLASAGAYACIVDALAAGQPAQMSSIIASDGDSGRTTSDGYDLPTRRITTWVVVGPGQVEETIDRSEDGGEITTRTCAAFAPASTGVPLAATDCS